METGGALGHNCIHRDFKLCTLTKIFSLFKVTCACQLLNHFQPSRGKPRPSLTTHLWLRNSGKRCHLVWTEVFRINLKVPMGLEERWKHTRRARQFRALWERWRPSSVPFGSSKHYSAQDWAVLGLEVRPAFSIAELLSLPEAVLGDRHFQTMTQLLLSPIQNRWDG